MSCPTCDHTMHRLGCQLAECAGSFVCPRCGTLKIGHAHGRFDIIAPALVDRCREFAKVVCGPKSLAAFNPKPLTPLVVLGA